MHLYFQSWFFCLLSSSHAHRIGFSGLIFSSAPTLRHISPPLASNLGFSAYFLPPTPTAWVFPVLYSLPRPLLATFLHLALPIWVFLLTFLLLRPPRGVFRSYILFRAHFTMPHDLLPKKEQDFHPALMCMNCTINYFSFLLRIIPVIPTPAPSISVIIIAIGYASPVETALSVFLSASVVFGAPACVVAPSGCSTNVYCVVAPSGCSTDVCCVVACSPVVVCSPVGDGVAPFATTTLVDGDA